MGLFGSLLKAGFDVVTAPIEVVKDAATLDGLITGRDESYTAERLKRLAADAEDVRDDLEDL